MLSAARVDPSTRMGSSSEELSMDFPTLIDSRRPMVCGALLVAGALALLLGAPAAVAQDYAPYRDGPGYYGNPPRESVEVIAPRYPRYAPGGARIDQVSLSREVRAYDLDLRTPWGADELRSRIRFTARVLCERIDRNFATVDDGRSCYYEAVDRAMEQADAAIAEARGSAYAR
jgi:UrcA family protein